MSITAAPDRIVAFNEAVRRGLVSRNPCDGVPALPLEQREIEFLRLAEIEPYLSACVSRRDSSSPVGDHVPWRGDVAEPAGRHEQLVLGDRDA